MIVLVLCEAVGTEEDRWHQYNPADPGGHVGGAGQVSGCQTEHQWVDQLDLAERQALDVDVKTVTFASSSEVDPPDQQVEHQDVADEAESDQVLGVAGGSPAQLVDEDGARDQGRKVDSRIQYAAELGPAIQCGRQHAIHAIQPEDEAQDGDQHAADQIVVHVVEQAGQQQGTDQTTNRCHDVGAVLAVPLLAVFGELEPVHQRRQPLSESIAAPVSESFCFLGEEHGPPFLPKNVP